MIRHKEDFRERTPKCNSELFAYNSTDRYFKFICNFSLPYKESIFLGSSSKRKMKTTLWIPILQNGLYKPYFLHEIKYKFKLAHNVHFKLKFDSACSVLFKIAQDNEINLLNYYWAIKICIF